MEIKAVGSFAVTRPAAPTAQAPEPQVATSGGQGESPKAQAGIYISPVIRYDQAAKLAVLFFRDADTGETRDQIPAERVVEEYRRAGGRSGGDATSGESPAGYERVSNTGTGGEASGSTPTTATGTTNSGTGGTTAGVTFTGTGGGYGGYGATTGAPVSRGAGAPGAAAGGARVSVTV